MVFLFSFRSSHQTTKDDSHNAFHNSRTNLINDNIYIEDVTDNEQNIGIYRENNNINRKHLSKKQQYLTSSAERQQQIDDDSMRRHEIDRGSDIDFNGRNNSLKTKREYFIKDGNVEILQLMTRGDKAEADENIYVNLPMKPSTTTNVTHPQLLMVENSGKEILMRRFIEEQPDGKQIIREHYQIVPGASYIQTLPNEVGTLPKESDLENEIKIIHTQQEGSTRLQNAQSTQSLHLELENSLKEQNALLRQILLEKEKMEIKYNQNETMLETQSLPCQSLEIATQTDCEMGTQTDPLEERARSAKKKRRSRSENDDSEDEFEYVRYSPPHSPDGVYWIKRRKSKKKSRGPRKRIVMVDEIKRKIRTPIKEEDDEFYEYRKSSPPKKPTRNHGETKTSMLRRMKNEKLRDDARNSSGSSLNHRILMEISDSLDEDHPSEEDYENDSDADQIVIKTNDGFGETQTFSNNGHRFEIRLSEGEQTSGPNPKPRLSRKDNQSKSKNIRTGGQTSSEPPNNRITITRSSIAPKKTSRERNYQSETDLLDHDEDHSKSVPKYMDWYYGKSKNSSSSRENTLKKDKKNTTKIKIGPNKKVVSGLERKIKQRQIKSDDTDDRISHKPEPAPRKTPPRNGRLLKEDVMMNKTHKPKIETDSNHPLLQHSEHRFEREYESEVPLAPTNLSHYMYPETPPSKESHSKKPIRDYKPKPSPIKENEIKITNSKINLYIEDSESKTKQLNVSTLEDDLDSGIAMNSLLHSMGRRNPIAEKKSVFSIAYDDISRVKKIQSGSDSPQYS